MEHISEISRWWQTKSLYALQKDLMVALSRSRNEGLRCQANLWCWSRVWFPLKQAVFCMPRSSSWAISYIGLSTIYLCSKTWRFGRLFGGHQLRSVIMWRSYPDKLYTSSLSLSLCSYSFGMLMHANDEWKLIMCTMNRSAAVGFWHFQFSGFQCNSDQNNVNLSWLSRSILLAGWPTFTAELCA